MSRTRPVPPAAPEEVVNPLWLLKAVGFTLIAALICAWLALCLLFYQGQWQLVLHPVRSSQPLDHIAGLHATPILFDAAETGLPRLSGVLIPPSASSGRASWIALYLRPGESSLAQDATDAATLQQLHALGLTVFAFDYRGFGASDPAHPTSARMAEDAEAALRYLLGRGTAENRIVLYGAGLGSSLAATLASHHPGIPALILDAPTPPTLQTVLADPRTRALPVRWLFHESFSLDALRLLQTPKLLISYPSPEAPTAPLAYNAAAIPKVTLELPRSQDPQKGQAIARFLDQFVPQT